MQEKINYDENKITERILLKDVFDFETLLENKKDKIIKLRFNLKWKNLDFVDLYLAKSPDFEPNILSSYSVSGKTKRNQSNELQFSFIKVEEGKDFDKWLFVGAYEIILPTGMIHKNSDGSSVEYAEARRLLQYDKFIERVIVKFKNSPQNFFYTSSAKINSVEIFSITDVPYFCDNTDFPGFEGLSLNYRDLKMRWNNKSWKENLSSVYGVYLITDLKNGKLYVGSACGEFGVYGRWSDYLDDKYEKNGVLVKDYPNYEFKKLVEKEGLGYIRKNFRFTLLEIFNKNTKGEKNCLKREREWMEVLQTEKFGYNYKREK